MYPHEYTNSFKRFYDNGFDNEFLILGFIVLWKMNALVKKIICKPLMFEICLMKKMGDYHNLCLKTGLWQKFIGVGLEYYGLDSCHYFSCLGLSWDAVLKTTGVELQLISGTNMYLFLAEDMRGISYIPKRHRKANNKYMKLYDYSKSTKYITYLDANDLHGWVMSQYLSHIGFKW